MGTPSAKQMEFAEEFSRAKRRGFLDLSRCAKLHRVHCANLEQKIHSQVRAINNYLKGNNYLSGSPARSSPESDAAARIELNTRNARKPTNLK